MGRPAGSAIGLPGWPDQQIATTANDVAHEASSRGLVSRWGDLFRLSANAATGQRRERQRSTGSVSLAGPNSAEPTRGSFMVVAVRPESMHVGDSDSLCAEPLLVSAAVASSMCGKSLRTWRAWDSAGLIPRPIRIGRSTLWRTEELKGWVAAGCPRRAEWESHS